MGLYDFIGSQNQEWGANDGHRSIGLSTNSAITNFRTEIRAAA